MKSHDYHIWIERLLSAMVRGYVPEHVWQVLVELSFLFHHLCSKEISRTVAQDLENAAHVLLYKPEKIFPPGFFLPMQHLIVHLPSEARLGGRAGPLVLSNREMSKDSSQKCTNKARIEAFIAEACIQEEVANFTTLYYKPNLPSNHNPLHYNTGKNESTLSLFQGQLGSASGSTNKLLGNEEWRSITLYVLTNLPEVQPFIK
jgi:hypothetical protein